MRSVVDRNVVMWRITVIFIVTIKATNSGLQRVFHGVNLAGLLCNCVIQEV
jgi:hypothetical protein